MRIVITDLPHRLHKYPTVGNYFAVNNLNGSEDRINVSDFRQVERDLVKAADYAFLVAVHEMTEMWLCKKRRISNESITAFDVAFEANPKKKGEPGDDKDAPYRKEHQFASKIEKLIAKELKVNWQKYDDAVNKLMASPVRR